MIASTSIVVFSAIVAIGIQFYFFQNTIKVNARDCSDSQRKLFDILDFHCAILSYLDIKSIHQCKRVNTDWNKRASHPSSTKTFNVLDYFTKKFFLPIDRFKSKPDGNSLTVFKELYHTLLYLINLHINWISSIMLHVLHCHKKTKSKIAGIIISNNADYQYK